MACPKCNESERIAQLSFIEGIYYEYQCQACGHVWYKGKDPFKKKKNEVEIKIESKF